MPSKFKDYKMHTAFYYYTGEPTTYSEAIESGDEWQQAVQKEIEALLKHETWTSANLPKGEKAIDTRWIFSTKQDGTKKARLVAKGFQEQCDENVYSPVARIPTIRLLLSHALNKDWSIKQLDVPTAFLIAI